jgi:adenosylcobinamide-phosphate synthase
MIGRVIGFLDLKFNNGTRRKLKGTMAFFAIVIAAGVIGCAISKLPYGEVFSLLIAAVLLAQNSLSNHVGAVAEALEGSLQLGKTEVSKIVGRDTGEMTQADVSRGAIESAAENLADGVVAPAFWFLLLGLPGLLVYKVTNTADSMIGYKTLKHKDFGWAAARFDDLLNWVPARLAAFMIALSSLCLRRFWQNRADAELHRSPNAGWPESAMAQALDVALSGPRSYEGQRKDFPFVNANGRKDPGPKEINAAVQALWRAWFLGLAVVALVAIA